MPSFAIKYVDMQTLHTFITLSEKQPLIGIPADKNGREAVRYSAVLPTQAVKQALKLAGAWADLNWTKMEKGLSHIRRSSKPTPPIEHL